MIKFQDMWLPDGEKHFPEWMEKSGEIVDGRGTYQIKKWRACIPYIKARRRALDVGAHVGFWTIQMMKHGFERIEAFEPIKELRLCWLANIPDQVNGSPVLHPTAVGNRSGWVAMKYNPEDTGGTHVERDAAMIDDDPMVVPIRPLDAYKFDDVDFLKIDCEGYEHLVIEGARETLLRCKPCVIVEQKQHIMTRNFGTEGTPAVDLLRELGAVSRKVISGDWICTWD